MIALNLLAVAIGVGLILTLVLTEAFGLAAGGLVVPGYMALSLLRPLSFLLTIVIALMTFAIVRALGLYIIVFGRRRTALMIVTAYLLGALVDLVLAGGVVVDAGLASGGPTAGAGSGFLEISVIGYIVPGLIALWFDRQGVLQTLCGLVVTAVLVRLVLVVAVPDALLAYDGARAGSALDWPATLAGP